MDNARAHDDLGIELAPAEPTAPVWRPRPHDDRATAVGRVGEGPPAAPEVYLHVRAVEEMFADALEHRHVETGGLLVGHLCEDGEGAHLDVTAVLQAPHAGRSAASLTFTQEAWNAMIGARLERYPDHEVVGWYHTHPNMRVFLSGPDLFIHRSFFSRAHDIAIVMDLERREWGVFRWKSRDELALATHFCVYGETDADMRRMEELLQRFALRTRRD